MCGYFFAHSNICEMLIYLNLSINYNIHNLLVFFFSFLNLFHGKMPWRRWADIPGVFASRSVEPSSQWGNRMHVSGNGWGVLLARMHRLVHEILDLFMVLQLVNFKGVRLTFPKQKWPHLSRVHRWLAHPCIPLWLNRKYLDSSSWSPVITPPYFLLLWFSPTPYSLN